MYLPTINAIPSLHESAEELRSFQDLYIECLAPQDPIQLFLVEMLYECHLNLRRLARWKAGAMESLARECWQRASLENVMTDGSFADYRDSEPQGNEMLAGNAMIGAVFNGDILERSVRMEQRALASFCRAWDQLLRIRLQEDRGFFRSIRKLPQPDLAPTGS
jgi:hypothetical protein